MQLEEKVEKPVYRGWSEQEASKQAHTNGCVYKEGQNNKDNQGLFAATLGLMLS